MMESWNEVRIGDLFEIKAGGDLQGGSYSPCKTEHAKWAIYANSLENKGLYGYTSEPRYRGNAVTITGRGDIGHAEFRDEDFDAIVRLLVLLPKVDVDCRYITYYINSLVHFPIESTGVPQLTAPKVKRIKINLPQKAEQTAIANILSKVDEAIASVQNSIAAAERLKKSLMQNLLTGKMKPDGTFRTPDEFYIDEKFGKVPVGWEVKKIKHCFKFKNGKGNTTSNLKEIPSDEYCIPVYGGNGITGYYHQALLEKPTIIVGRVGEYCGNVFKTVEKSWVTDNAMLVSEVLMDSYNIDFFTMKMNSLKFKQYGDTTGQPKITQSSIGGISFAYPHDVKEQNMIALMILSVQEFVEKQKRMRNTIERLKKSLMQNLLTKKIRIM